MAESTTVSDQGQPTIPKEIRDKYGIKPGDEIVWRDTDNGVVVEQVFGGDTAGMLFDDDVPDEERERILEEMSEEIREKRETEWAIE